MFSKIKDCSDSSESCESSHVQSCQLDLYLNITNELYNTIKLPVN